MRKGRPLSWADPISIFPWRGIGLLRGLLLFGLGIWPWLLLFAGIEDVKPRGAGSRILDSVLERLHDGARLPLDASVCGIGGH
jgi:hypothetical protein